MRSRKRCSRWARLPTAVRLAQQLAAEGLAADGAPAAAAPAAPPSDAAACDGAGASGGRRSEAAKECVRLEMTVWQVKSRAGASSNDDDDDGTNADGAFLLAAAFDGV